MSREKSWPLIPRYLAIDRRKWTVETFAKDRRHDRESREKRINDSELSRRETHCPPSITSKWERVATIGYRTKRESRWLPGGKVRDAMTNVHVRIATWMERTVDALFNKIHVYRSALSRLTLAMQHQCKTLLSRVPRTQEHS